MSIYLDIGGTIFKTTRETLIMAPYFQGLERHAGQIFGTKDNPLFIDRDPEIFKHVLNILRNPEYNFPTEYLSELSFWGFQIEDFTDRGRAVTQALNHPSDLYLIRKPVSTRRLIQTIYGTPQITYHNSIIRQSTFYCNPVNRRSFDKLPWSLEITDEFFDHCYILIPRSCKLHELLNFELDIKIDEVYQNRIHLHQYMILSIDQNLRTTFTIDGFHYIPISMLVSNNSFPILKTPQKKIILTLKHNELVNLPTAICYYTPKMAYDERQLYNAVAHEFFIQEVTELPINGDKVTLPSGLLRYLIWKTNEPIEEISLISSKKSFYTLNQATIKDETSYSMKRGDFQYLERAKIGLDAMDSMWGAMYLCRFPYSVLEGGGIDIDDTYFLKFSKSTTGYLWVYSTQIWYLSENQTLTISK